MKKLFSALLITLFLSASAVAMDHSAHSGHAASQPADGAAMDHSSMNHGGSMDGSTYRYAAMVDGIHAEFQVMDLASMNMKDPEGRTHHIMVSFMKDGQKIEKAVGKVKIIAPSGKEQVATLHDFGSGVFAANFSFDEMGKWGVICLFKEGDGTHTVKFWYSHM